MQTFVIIVLLQVVYYVHNYFWPDLRKGIFHTLPVFIDLEDHNFVVKKDMKLKLSPAIKLCWCFLLTKFQVNTYLLPIWSYESSKLVKWMCVEDPYSQTQSHLCLLFTMLHLHYTNVWLVHTVFIILIGVQKSKEIRL